MNLFFQLINSQFLNAIQRAFKTMPMDRTFKALEASFWVRKEYSCEKQCDGRRRVFFTFYPLYFLSLLLHHSFQLCHFKSRQTARAFHVTICHVKKHHTLPICPDINCSHTPTMVEGDSLGTQENSHEFNGTQSGKKAGVCTKQDCVLGIILFSYFKMLPVNSSPLPSFPHISTYNFHHP